MKDPQFQFLGAGANTSNKWKVVAALLGVLSIGLLTTTIAFAVLLATTRPQGGPAMVHVPRAMFADLPLFENDQGSLSYLGDFATSTVPGKEMAAGCYRLKPGPSLTFTYTYDEFKWIVDGEFHLIDGTGKTVVAKKGDLMKFPAGTKVTFSNPTAEDALGCFVGQRDGDASGGSSPRVQAEIKKNPTMIHFPEVMTRELSPFGDSGNNFLDDFAELGFNRGSEMTAGCYRMTSGPSLHYTYEYEEMKWIVDGKFALADGAGQKIQAKAGDLVYFPKGTSVWFSAQDAKGCYVGQRVMGTA